MSLCVAQDRSQHPWCPHSDLDWVDGGKLQVDVCFDHEDLSEGAGRTPPGPSGVVGVRKVLDNSDGQRPC